MDDGRPYVIAIAGQRYPKRTRDAGKVRYETFRNFHGWQSLTGVVGRHVIGPDMYQKASVKRVTFNAPIAISSTSPLRPRAQGAGQIVHPLDQFELALPTTFVLAMTWGTSATVAAGTKRRERPKAPARQIFSIYGCRIGLSHRLDQRVILSRPAIGSRSPAGNQVTETIDGAHSWSGIPRLPKSAPASPDLRLIRTPDGDFTSRKPRVWLC